jgi:SAM-dependent methyltransferase
MTSAPLYNSFAAHYDSVVGPREDVARYLHKLIRGYHPHARSVLELGCGSGSMLQTLSRHYETVGIDSSRAMLSLARKKAPKASLVLGDITSFSLKRPFDVILCPFDTINHVTSFAKWKKIFANVHSHISPNGIFIFDVNTEHKMESYRLDPVQADISANSVSIVEVSRQVRYKYTVHLRLFRRVRGDTFKRYCMDLPELVVPTPKITQALSAFFRSVTLVDPDRSKPSELTEELYFVCRNPR